MLRLWPDTVSIGLFPGHCWIKYPSMDTPAIHALAPNGDLAELLSAFDTMLADPAHRLRSADRLTVTTSDGIAAVCAMPWQDNLHTTAELEMYATMCFEKNHQLIDKTWVAHADFRRCGSVGMAYAYPRAWLTQLVQMAAKYQVQLRTVMPLCARAYFRAPRLKRRKQSLVLLQEPGRISAMIYHDGKLHAYDVEPITNSAGTAGRRQLRRLAGASDNIRQIHYWTQDEDAATVLSAAIAAEEPEAQLARIATMYWK